MMIKCCNALYSDNSGLLVVPARSCWSTSFDTRMMTIMTMMMIMTTMMMTMTMILTMTMRRLGRTFAHFQQNQHFSIFFVEEHCISLITIYDTLTVSALPIIAIKLST